MNLGEIIEFSSGDDHRIGVIVGEIGKKKLEVVTSEGDEMRATRKEVTFETGVSVADYSSTSVAQSGARRFAKKVEEFAEELDLPILWQFVSDMGEAMGPEGIAELFFATTEPAARLAVLSVLRDDIVYFKQKKGPTFEPRSESQVEELKKQVEAELQKERERQNFVDGVVEILKADDDARAEVADAKMADPDFRKFARIIQKYAIYDQDHDRADQAKELLDEIEDGYGRHLKGRYGSKAFHLMVDMTVWDEHENLHLLRHNISPDIADEIVEAAQVICERSWEPEGYRRDLTDVLMFSIDSASTKDIDDAISCEKLPDGGYRVGVHIADPSARVAAGCNVDLEARGRGTSIYLPTGIFPMFPHSLSHEKMSLVAGELRPAVSSLMTFNADLELVDTEIVPAMVEVDHRLTYDGVDQILANPSEADLPGLDTSASENLASSLQSLQKIARALHEERVSNGAVNIDLPELKLKVDYTPGGEPTISTRVLDSNSPSRQLVSEVMVLNNRVLGEFCRDHELPTIFRGQAPPEEELYTDDILSLPEGLAREFALVRKMKPGDVTTQPTSHFGLGLAVYVQASSPIRRYTDLVAQRQIKAFLAEEALPYGESDIMEVLGSVESAARGAYLAERETTRYWTLYHLGTTLKGEPLEATVVEHKGHDKAAAAVFVHDVAFKANCKFRDRPPVGAKCEVMVVKADPRKDVLQLRGA
ncbi:ribonuclease catalytic domain-containing protein [Persicimonas caeni]|nr:ribonuclease catalytic domain-containing protein [Persicimonas caeni]